ncbi:DUF3261 domain-containing protein [Neisseria sp. Ec49-e6-T10]|uniref:DUF3261 domain-containing protein n=1 Tax=Neisseria sp. Ec49-e6-T10 TaxID=3140744 RepID=UPI003EBEEA33
MKYFNIWLLSLILLLAGCATKQNNEAWLTRGTKITLPPPGIAMDIHKQQLLTTTVKGQQHSLMVLLDANEQEIKLVGLSAIGIRLFTVQYNQQGIQTKQFIKIAQLPPAPQVLSDIMLSYWPTAVWQNHLPEGWTLTDTEQQRLLKNNKGETITEIHYQNQHNKREPVSLKQHYFGYEITLTNMDDEP